MIHENYLYLNFQSILDIENPLKNSFFNMYGRLRNFWYITKLDNSIFLIKMKSCESLLKKINQKRNFIIPYFGGKYRKSTFEISR